MSNKTEEMKTPTLSEFVRTAILDIAAGLNDAQDKGRELGVKINPDSYGDHSTPTEIEFDLSVSSITQEKGTGGIKIGVSSILGMDTGKEGTMGTESSKPNTFCNTCAFCSIQCAIFAKAINPGKTSNNRVR